MEVEVTEGYLVVLRGIYDNNSLSVELIVGDDLTALQQELQNIMGFRMWPSINLLEYGFHIAGAYQDDGGSGEFNKMSPRSSNSAELEQYLRAEYLQTLPYDSFCIDGGAALNKQLAGEYLPFLDRFKVANKSVILNVVLRLRCWDSNADNPAANDDCDESYEVLMNNSQSNEKSAYRTRINDQPFAYLDWTAASVESSMASLLNTTIESLKLGIDGLVLQGNWLQDDQLTVDWDQPPAQFPFTPGDLRAELGNTLVPPWKTVKKKKQVDNLNTAAAYEETIWSYNAYASQSVRLVNEYLWGLEDDGQIGSVFLSSESSAYPNTNTLLRGVVGAWEALNSTREKVLSHSMTGLLTINANICGDTEPSRRFNEELCVRWYQFASLTPIYRTLTSVAPPQRFSKFNEKVIIRTTRFRYSLASYFLTMRLVHPLRALATPIIYDYPQLYEDTEVGNSWMGVGVSLFAGPILTPTQHSLVVRLPELVYEINDGARVPENTTKTLSIVSSDLPVFIRAGHIIATHLVEVGRASYSNARGPKL